MNEGDEEKRETRYRSTQDFFCSEGILPTFRKERKGIFWLRGRGVVVLSSAFAFCFAFPRRTQNGSIPQPGTRVLVLFVWFLVFLIRKGHYYRRAFCFVVTRPFLLIIFAKLDSFERKKHAL
jgi:hypothetical protein